MLGDLLEFLQSVLQSYFQLIDLENATVVFLKAQTNAEVISFEQNTITPILINLEEETIMRKADPYVQYSNTGEAYQVYPELRLNCYILFVSNYTHYPTGLNNLSYLIKYFQSKRVFTRSNSPNLPAEIEKLTAELVTLPFAQQNEVWNALRTAYKPSTLYRFRLIVFQEEETSLAQPEVTEIKQTTTQNI